MENKSPEQELLPKPQTDLPLPRLQVTEHSNVGQAEKQIPAHLASQGQALGGQSTTGFLKSKFFWGFIIMSALIAFLVGGIFLGKNINKNTQAIINPTPIPDIYKDSPSPDPTADWKTFTGSKYGYSIKYPSTLETNEIENPFYLASFKKIDSPQGTFSTYDILAAPDTFLVKNPSSYNFIDSETINTLRGLTSKDDSITLDTSLFKYIGNMIIGDQKAIVVEVTSTVENQTHQKRVIFNKNGNNYIIVNNENNSNNQDDFNKFLSTFKFTDSSVDTSTWKTYTGQHVSFNYPAAWNPTNTELCCGVILEDINLGIPDSNTGPDMNLGFSDVELSEIRIDDAINETPVKIGGKDGFKYVRKSDNSTSYDYHTTGTNNKDSFSVHVTVSTENKALELELDNLVKSIKFN